MKTWWKIRRLSSFLFPSLLFLLFSDWFLPACPCFLWILFWLILGLSLSAGTKAMAELILLGAAPPFFFLSVNLCFFTLYFCSVCFSSGFLLAFSAFFFLCFWVDFFVCRLSAEMKAMAMKTLYVCWISFLSFSLCIISLLWVFFALFSLLFFSVFGFIFRFIFFSSP